MSASSGDYVDTLKTIPTYLYQYIGIPLFMIGNIGNFLCLVIFFKSAWRKNVCVFYFIIYSIDNIVSINSSLIGSIFVTGFNIQAQNSSVILCKLFFYVAFVSTGYQALVLIAASIDRLLVSSQDVDTRLYSSKRLAYVFVFASIFIWSMFSLHALIKVNIIQYGPSIFVCYYELTQDYLIFFMCSTIIISIVIPLVLVVVSIITFKNVHRNRKNRHNQTHQIRTMHKKDFQLLRCLYVCNIVYISCSILVAVSVVLDLTTRFQTSAPMEEAVNNFLQNLGYLLHHIPSCLNIIILVCMSKAFRVEAQQIAEKIFCSIPATETNPIIPMRDAVGAKPAINTIVLNSL